MLLLEDKLLANTVLDLVIYYLNTSDCKAAVIVSMRYLQFM